MPLLAAYAYDEGSGTTTADASGNGRTATLNSATFTTGHTNTGITNTGSTQGATSAVPALTTAAVTLMAWVKPLDLTAGTSRFVCGIVQSNGNSDCVIMAQRNTFGTPNVLQGAVRVNGGLVAVNGTALTVGTWVHVALTYDGATARLYRDGTQIATASVGGTFSLGTDLYAAGAIAAANFGTQVVVDDVRYYNEVLDATAIATAMNTPVASSSDIRTQSGTATLTLGATGVQTREAVATGTAVVTLAATGAAVAERTAAGSASLALAATGTTVREAIAAGTAPLALSTVGQALAERIRAGAALLTLLATGVVAGETIPVAADPRLTVRPNMAALAVAANRAALTTGGPS